MPTFTLFFYCAARESPSRPGGHQRASVWAAAASAAGHPGADTRLQVHYAGMLQFNTGPMKSCWFSIQITTLTKFNLKNIYFKSLLLSHCWSAPVYRSVNLLNNQKTEGRSKLELLFWKLFSFSSYNRLKPADMYLQICLRAPSSSKVFLKV